MRLVPVGFFLNYLVITCFAVKLEDGCLYWGFFSSFKGPSPRGPICYDPDSNCMINKTLDFDIIMYCLH